MKKEDINFTVLGKLADLVLKIQAVECEQDIRVRVELATNKLLEDVARIAWENLRAPVSDDIEAETPSYVIGVLLNGKGKTYEYRTELNVRLNDEVWAPVANGRCLRAEVEWALPVEDWAPTTKKLEELSWVDEIASKFDGS
jgi:hypothetical protein